MSKDSYHINVEVKGINKLFMSKVFPYLKSIGHFSSNAKCIPIESITTDNAIEMDTKYGMDYVILDGDTCYTYASRIQGPKIDKVTGTKTIKDYEGWTIRTSYNGSDNTEAKKRVEAIDGNKPYPKYTLQAYLDGEDDKANILGVYIVNTKDLIKVWQIISNRLHDFTMEDGNIFQAVSFKNMHDTFISRPKMELGFYHPVYRSDYDFYRSERAVKWHN